MVRIWSRYTQNLGVVNPRTPVQATDDAPSASGSLTRLGQLGGQETSP